MEEKPKRRWPQFKLRTVLIVLGLLCIPLAQYPYLETKIGRTAVVGFPYTGDLRVMTETTSTFSPTPRLLYALAADAAILICWWMLTPSKPN